MIITIDSNIDGIIKHVLKDRFKYYRDDIKIWCKAIDKCNKSGAVNDTRRNITLYVNSPLSMVTHIKDHKLPPDNEMINFVYLDFRKQNAALVRLLRNMNGRENIVLFATELNDTTVGRYTIIVGNAPDDIIAELLLVSIGAFIETRGPPTIENIIDFYNQIYMDKVNDQQRQKKKEQLQQQQKIQRPPLPPPPPPPLPKNTLGGNEKSAVCQFTPSKKSSNKRPAPPIPVVKKGGMMPPPPPPPPPPQSRPKKSVRFNDDDKNHYNEPFTSRRSQSTSNLPHPPPPPPPPLPPISTIPKRKDGNIRVPIQPNKERGSMAENIVCDIYKYIDNKLKQCKEIDDCNICDI